MKKAIKASCLIPVILLFASQVFADQLRLGLVGFNYTKTPYTLRDGTADGWVTITSDPNTGVNLNIGSNVDAYADIDKWSIDKWGEDAKGQMTITWWMELALLGDPGDSAEVVGEWDLWLAYLIGAEPSDFLMEATNASIETQASILAKKLVCIPLAGCVQIPWPLSDASGSVGDMVVWLGVDGGGKEITGEFSLGTYTVGDHFYMVGGFDSLAWADESDFGRADSWGLSNYSLRMNLKNLTIPDPPPLPSLSEVPEPTSLLLLGTGLGAIGLAAWRRRK